MRRKSSLVPSESHDDHYRPHSARKMTSCYVHQLLDEHRSGGTHTPNNQGLAAGKKSDKDPHGQNGAETPHTESRLLTKRQLRDMAFGIRELSKKLGHVKLKLKVRNVFILTKAHDESLIAHSRDLSEWLLKKDPGYTVWVEDTMKEHKNFDAQGLLATDKAFEGRLKYWDNELCRKKPSTFDIVLGVSIRLLRQSVVC